MISARVHYSNRNHRGLLKLCRDGPQMTHGPLGPGPNSDRANPAATTRAPELGLNRSKRHPEIQKILQKITLLWS